MMAMIFAANAEAATRWVGNATTNFSPVSAACTGVGNPSTNNYVSGATGGSTNSSAVTVFLNSSNSFVYAIDTPFINWGYSNGLAAIYNVYSPHFVFTLNGGGSAGALMANVAVTGASWSGSASFDGGGNLNFDYTVSYTVSGGSACQIRFYGTAVDGGA